MSVQNNLRYMCGQYYLITVHFVMTPVVVHPLVELATGERAGEEQERTMQTCHPHENFTRDDIDSDEVQRGFKRLTVGPVVRRMLPSEGVSLLCWKNRVRIVIKEGTGTDPYFMGFARTLRQAATWVATGKPALLVPWERIP